MPLHYYADKMCVILCALGHYPIHMNPHFQYQTPNDLYISTYTASE